MFNNDFITATLTNCVLRDNSLGEIFDNVAVTTVRYTNIEGGWFGVGSNNIDADPAFVDPVNGDYRLTSSSPGIDAGHNWDNVSDGFFSTGFQGQVAPGNRGH